MRRARAALAASIAGCISIAAGAEARYAPPRASDGKPDLQGVWTNASLTTLERANQYSSLVIPAADIVRATDEHPQTIRQRTDDNLSSTRGPLDGSDLKSGRGYNAFWTDPGSHFGVVKGQHRSSWIVEPASGKIPYTERARAMIAALPRDNFDGPEMRPLAERCLAIGGRVGPPMINGLYNNNYQIVQTTDHVVILIEMVQHARVIRLARTHAPRSLQPLFGDSIGRWDGDTLEVETTNFSPWHARSANPAHLSASATVTERFTRVSPTQIFYEFSVEDPQLYAQVWRGELTFEAAQGPVYEYACHEGNYALTGVLSGARAQERRVPGNASR
jgi:hypothetical protein